MFTTSPESLVMPRGLARCVVLADEDFTVGAYPDEDEYGGFCAHRRVEPLLDQPHRGICVRCDTELALRVAGAAVAA
jgi:hypothetical protein